MPGAKRRQMVTANGRSSQALTNGRRQKFQLGPVKQTKLVLNRAVLGLW